jgi:hypothetical protein
MKSKILMLFVLATTLFSCSNDDNSGNDLKIVKKVVFYGGTANERHWIITNGLLSEITLADGTIVEKFIYDAQFRLASDIKYSNGEISANTEITYNADSTIKSIDGLPYVYNAATKKYTYSYGSNFTIDCEVNSDMLAVNFIRMGANPSEYHMAYSNHNMTSFEKVGAVLAVARVKSLTDPSFFIDCQASLDMPNGFDKGTSDPNYYNYGGLPDMSGKHFQVSIEVLYNNSTFVDSYSFADYYYQ